MSDDMSIEIIGGAEKAVQGIENIINSLSKLQQKLSSCTSDIQKFTNSLKSINAKFDVKINTSGLNNAVSQTNSVTNEIVKSENKLQNFAKNIKYTFLGIENQVGTSFRGIKEKISSFSSNLKNPFSFSKKVDSPKIQTPKMDVPSMIQNFESGQKLSETDIFIKHLSGSIGEMSSASKSSFNAMTSELRVVNSELLKQKEIYKKLSGEYKNLKNLGFSDSLISKMGVNTSKISDSISKIKSLSAESERLKNSMKELSTPTNQASKSIKNIGNSSRNASKSMSAFDRALRAVKTYFLVGAVNKLSESFSNALQNAMNFTENMNLFNISMDENSLRVGDFVDKMSTVFGMDSSNLVRTMGNFYQISHSMGMTSENAYTLSENFTKLANDLSSFYNIPVNDAVIKLQAGLVGETEPLRRLGIIITENALKQTAMNLGIQKSVRDMSEAEKMHLRYITVMQQTANIQGDFARTINEPAQAIRTLQEQLSQFSRAIGSVFMPILGAVLPYIIAFARALTTVIGVFAKFLGYKTPEYKNFATASIGAGNLAKSMGNAGKGTDKLGKSLGSATKKAKELRKQIMGFDELNILTKPSENAGIGSSGSGKGGSIGGVGGDFAVPDLTGYDNLMDTVNNKIDEIYKNIIDVFYKIGEALAPTKKAFERLGVELERLGNFAWSGLLDFYNSFLVPVGNWVFGEGLPRFVDAVTNGLAKVSWDKINDSLHNLWTNLAPFSITVGKGLLWFWEKVLVPIGSWTLNNVVPTFLNLLSGTIAFLTPIVDGCISGLDWLWSSFLSPMASWTGGVICDVLNNLSGILMKIGEWISRHTKIIENLTIILGSFAIAWGIVTAAVTTWNVVCGISSVVTGAFAGAIAFLTSPVGVVILAIGALIAVVVLLIKHWDSVKSAAISCWESIVNGFNTAIDWFKSNWQGLLLLLVNPFVGAFKLIYDNCTLFREFVDNLVDNIKRLFSDLWSNTSNLAVKCWDKIANIWGTVTSWFDKNITSPIKNLFSGLWTKIQNIFGSASSWFGNIFSGAYNAVKSAFSGVINFFSGIWQTIKSTFTNIGSTIGNAIGGAFKTVVNSIIGFAGNSINGFIRAINTAISVINFIPGVNITKISELNIPRLAKGGLVTESVLANIGEGNNDEAVLPLNDEVFRKLANGINKNNADNTQIISEESLYRAFFRALQEVPERTTTFVATLNNKIIAREVLKEQQNQHRRFNPVNI